MDDVKYRVIFKGEVSTGFDIEEVKQKVGEAFKADTNKIEQLFSGNEIIVKKNASYEECEKMVRIFEGTGARANIEEEKDLSPESQGPPPLPSIEERKKSMAGRAPFKNADEKFCSTCGAVIKLKSLSCPRCGTKQIQTNKGGLPGAVIALAAGVFGIAIIGIIAAIAIPQFHAYRTKAYQATVKNELRQIYTAQEVYFDEHDRYSGSLEELNYFPPLDVSIEITELEEECYTAKGESTKISVRYYIDCDGKITEEKVRQPVR